MDQGRSSFLNPHTRVSKDEAWVIFRAGFLNSSEGWNGGDPFESPPSPEAARKNVAYLYAQFEDWFGEHCV